MGLKPARMSITKITLERRLGRSFLSQIGAQLDLEIIDLVKTINIEPTLLTEEESSTIALSEEFHQLSELTKSIKLPKKSKKISFEKESLQELNSEAKSLLEKTKPVFEEFKDLTEQQTYLNEVKTAVQSLKVLQGLNIHDVQDFGAGTHFYAVLGFLKGIHLFRLEMALDQLTGGEFIFKPVSSGKTKTICLIGVMKAYRAPLDRLLSGLGFETIRIPPKITGPPEKAMKEAVDLQNNLEKELAESKEKVLAETRKEIVAIQTITEQLNLERNRLTLLQKSQLKKDHFIIWAWIPNKQTRSLKKIIKKIDPSIQYEIIKNPKLEDEEFPSKIKNNLYSRNFEDLVHGFGTPGYNEWDPTKILSILIPVFFGIMFGDVIDGFIVLLIGLYGLSLSSDKYSKNSMLSELQMYFDKGGPILVTFGITAMFFGFMFGSYRGLGGEHAHHLGLDPLWFSPELEGGQFALLEFAIVLGILAIGFALFLQFIHLLSHNKMEAIFLPGMFLIFYGSLAFLLFAYGPNPIKWLTETTGTVDLIALQEKTAESRIGDMLGLDWVEHMGIPVFAIGPMSYPMFFLIVSLILTTIFHFKHGMDGMSEWLDYLITMISNTISFARVFAYNMVHGSLSLVFIQLLAGSGESWGAVLPGMILGGFIVIPLELLVSFLQSLRLCWVEFFGKLAYQGSGHKFVPYREKRILSTIST
ncbi:MAG: V-type ATPase 116kDa subunit family protein [Candidatus Hodarchaeales archaeon]